MTTETLTGFEFVTCIRCREKLAVAPRNEHGYPIVSQVYQCGNLGRVEMGHQMAQSKTGRVAMCLVAKS